MKNRSAERFLTRGERILLAINSAFLVICFLAVALPLIYILNASVSSASAVMAGRVFLWPVDFTLDAYKEIFNHGYILDGYLNSVYYTVVGTIVNVIVTVMAAYPLSRRDFTMRNWFMFLFAFTMWFSGGLVPSYLVASQLGLINNFWVMILPGAMSVYNMIIMRTFFESNISPELHEAAQLDGCSDIRFIVRLVLPLSGAIMAVIGLFYAVGHWNSYFNALIYLNDRDMYPLQIVLREILIMNQMSSSNVVDTALYEKQRQLMELLKYSLIIVASVPVLCIYPFVQRFFVKGVMVGAIKG